MTIWKSYANSTGMPKSSSLAIQQGSGHANQSSNNVSLLDNTSPGAWVLGQGNSSYSASLPNARSNALGVFPVTAANKANTTGEAAKIHALGWNLRKSWEGPIVSATAVNGSLFANGETVLVSNGTANAVLTLTANATGNLTSAAVSTTGVWPNNTSISAVAGPGGRFTNTASIPAGAITFSREWHVSNLNFSNATALTGVGNGNTINVLVSSNTTNGLLYGQTAVNQLTSNSTGGITNTITQALTWAGTFGATNYWGLFNPTIAANPAATAVVVTFTNANGTAVGGTFTATANLVTSTGGSVTPTLGGRAGRVQYEALAVDRHVGMPLNTITVTGAASGYNNTDFILVVGSGVGPANSTANNNANGALNVASNAAYANIRYLVGMATISTNSTGGFSNAGNTSANLTIVNFGNYANLTGASVNAIVLAANGTAVSNGSSAVLVANLFWTAANSSQLPSS